MARNIYIVDAFVIDANGAFGRLDQYPKQVDSKNYDGDVDKARRRAEGYFAEVWTGFCRRDDRMKQTVVLYSADGTLIDKKTTGTLDTEPAS